MGYKDLFRVSLARAIMDSGHFSDMDAARRQRFAQLAQEELEHEWPDIERALAIDLSKTYSLEQVSDMAAFAKTPIVRKIMRTVIFGDPMPTKPSLNTQDIADLQQIKDKPYLRDLLGFGVNTYQVQDRIEAVMYRAYDRLTQETTP
jgi:hypothetical protein